MASRFSAALMFACLLLFGMIGCSRMTPERSPKELLDLSVSGLAGVDRYTFTGTSEAISTSGVKVSQSSFSGSIADHTRIQMHSNEASSDTSRTIGNPLAYLKQLQLEAGLIKLVPEQEGDASAKTMVVQIDSEAAALRERWVKRLRSDFEQAVLNERSSSRKPGQMTEHIQALQDEAGRSREQFGQMLQSLKVKTTYKLIIDRKKLLPLQLNETTVLRYRAQGTTQTETHHLKMSIVPASDR